MLAQLRRNLFLLYTAELLGKILGLVVFGYLARVLLPARYGDLEFALGVLFLLNLVIDAGLGHYGAREAAKRPGDTDRLVGQIAIVRGGLVVLSLLLLAAVSTLQGVDSTAKMLIVLQGLVLLPAPLILTWVFQARDEMHVVAVAAVIRQVALAGGVLFFVRGPEDVLLVPVWDGIGLGLAVALQVLLFARAGGRINPPRFVEGLSLVVRESAPLAASSVVWAIRLFAPLLALGVFRDSAEVGLFGAGHRLVIAAHTFVWLYFFNLLPSLSRLGVEDELTGFRDLFTASMRLVAWISICGASLGSILAAEIIPVVYGDAMSAASDPFAVMIWMLTVGFISGHHRFALIALSLQDREFWASAVGALVSVAGCVLVGADLSPMSAAAIFVVGETTTFIAASALLHWSVKEMRVLQGLGIPTVFAAAGMALLGIWSPKSPWVAAGALATLYATAVALFERSSIRRLVTLRAAGVTDAS